MGDLSNGGSIEGSAAFSIDQLISTTEQQNSKRQPRSENATLICPDGVSNMFLEISGMQFVILPEFMLGYWPPITSSIRYNVILWYAIDSLSEISYNTALFNNLNSKCHLLQATLR